MPERTSWLIFCNCGKKIFFLLHHPDPCPWAKFAYLCTGVKWRVPRACSPSPNSKSPHPAPCLELFKIFVTPTHGGELRTQKLKSHLLRTQSLKVLPSKPGVSQYRAVRATLTAGDFFLADFYPSGPFTCIFFPKLLPSSSCVSFG